MGANVNEKVLDEFIRTEILTHKLFLDKDNPRGENEALVQLILNLDENANIFYVEDESAYDPKASVPRLYAPFGPHDGFKAIEAYVIGEKKGLMDASFKMRGWEDGILGYFRDRLTTSECYFT